MPDLAGMSGLSCHTSWISLFFSAFFFLLSTALLDVAFFPIRDAVRIFLHICLGAQRWGKVALELKNQTTATLEL